MKKFDVVIIGGGPAGLTAARTAAQEGLKVVVVERKKDITEINRACLQLFYLKWIGPDAYLGPVDVQLGSDNNKFIWPDLDLEIEYKGPLTPYRNAIWFSPSSIPVYAFKNDLFGFFFKKEDFLEGLLNEAKSAGAQIMPGTMVVDIENTAHGVRTLIKDGMCEQTIESKYVIAADGNQSTVVKRLTNNDNRFIIAKDFKVTASYIDGIVPNILGHESAWLSFDPRLSIRIALGLYEGTAKWVLGEVDDFLKVPAYRNWFTNHRVIKKTTFSGNWYSATREPVIGNVFLAGDAVATEAWIQGAVACGHKAVKCIMKEMAGQDGFQDYTNWVQHTLFATDIGYYKSLIGREIFAACTAEEVDYIYNWLLENEIPGFPHFALARNLKYLNASNPDLFRKIRNDQQLKSKQMKPLLDMYPQTSQIFKDQRAWSGLWKNVM